MVIVESITEYDIAKCNINVLRDADLIDDKTYEELDKAPKLERNVKIGLMLQGNRKLYESLTAAVTNVVDEFIEWNKLKDRILYRVNDAVWIIGASPEETQMTERVNFVAKNTCDILFEFNKIRFHLDTKHGIFFVIGLGKEGGKKPNGEFRHMCKFVERMMRFYVANKQELMYKAIHQALEYYTTIEGYDLQEPMSSKIKENPEDRTLDLNYKLLNKMLDEFIEE